MSKIKKTNITISGYPVFISEKPPRKKAGRPRIYTYEIRLTKGQSKLIGEALSEQGRITIKDFGILKLTGIKKSRRLNPTKKKIMSFPAVKKVNLRAIGEFYKFIQAL